MTTVVRITNFILGGEASAQRCGPQTAKAVFNDYGTEVISNYTWLKIWKSLHW